MKCDLRQSQESQWVKKSYWPQGTHHTAESAQSSLFHGHHIWAQPTHIWVTYHHPLLVLTAKWNWCTILCALAGDEFKDKGWKTLWERKLKMRALKNQVCQMKDSRVPRRYGGATNNATSLFTGWWLRPKQTTNCHSLGQEIPGSMKYRPSFLSKPHKWEKMKEGDHKPIRAQV